MKNYFLHPESIRKLFDNIAPSYDFLNHLLSLRRDLYWRKVAVQSLKGWDGWILDVATGTGDVAIEIIRQSSDPRKVFGLDFSMPMVREAHRKLLKRGLSGQVSLSIGDAISLPFHENTFSASLIAFGLRNIVEKEKALAEMIRVIKKGGKVIILEFTLPRRGVMKIAYPLYFKKFLPWLGGLVSGDRAAYAYLPESVYHFPYTEDYEEMMIRSGLEKVSSMKLTGGVVSLITGYKKSP